MSDNELDDLIAESKRRKSAKKRGRPPKAERKREERPTHDPIMDYHGPLAHLKNYQEDGYFYKLVNNNGKNVQEKLNIGYEPVLRNQIENKFPEFDYDSKLSKYVMASLGDGLEGLLMRIPEALYNERIEYKKQRNQESIQAIYPDERSTGIKNYEFKEEVVK